MASPITPSTGLGSGLAIGSIVDALVGADKLAKQTQITAQTKLVSTKLSGIGTLKSAVDAFQAAMKTLNDATNPAFNGYAAKSSDVTKLTVTSNNNAVPGNYTVNVTNIATSSSVATAAFSGGATSAIPSGKLTITQNGTSTDFAIPDGSTLASVAKQINASTDSTNISANIITDANGSRLVLGSTITGAGSDITTSSDISGFTISSGKALDTTSASSAGYIGDQAKSAKLTINGLPVTSASNKLDSTLSGVTMNLLADNSNITINVATNTDGLKTSLQSFITSYNAVVGAVSSVTKATVNPTPDPTTGATVVAAPLTGDSMPRSILSAMRSVLVTTGAAGNLSVLSQLGITTSQTDGTLSLDSTKFQAAMDKGLAGDVQQMFSGTTDSNGLISRMNAALNPFTQTGGMFATRTSSLNTQQNDLTNQQADLDLRVSKLTATLTAKYNAMDLVVGQLKASATSITSFFDSLNAQKNG